MGAGACAVSTLAHCLMGFYWRALPMLQFLCEQKEAQLGSAALSCFCTLEHNEADTAEVFLICPVLVINTAGDGFRAIVEQVVMQLPITWAELLLFEEQRVVHK